MFSSSLNRSVGPFWIICCFASAGAFAQEGMGDTNTTADRTGANELAEPADLPRPEVVEPGQSAAGVPDSVPAPEIDFRDLTWTRRVSPNYPEAGRGQRYPGQKCMVVIQVDERGVTKDPIITGCAEPFVEETRRVVTKWRAQPVVLEGRAVTVQTRIQVRFGER